MPDSSGIIFSESQSGPDENVEEKPIVFYQLLCRSTLSINKN